MNLGHPFIIYGLCKNAKVPLEDNMAWIHPIKAIVVKKDKPSVPRSNAVYDSGHEPLDEEELAAYPTLFGMSEETPGEADPPSTSHPPHPSTPWPPLLHLPLSRLSLVLRLPLRTRFRTSLPCVMHYGMRPGASSRPELGYGCTMGRHSHNPPQPVGHPIAARPVVAHLNSFPIGAPPPPPL